MGCTMAEQTDFPEFRFKGLPVGTFAEAVEPESPGRYRYEKYRGVGHLEMQQALRACKSARCEYTLKGRRVEFSVTAEPEYGVLELEGIKTRAR